MDATALREELAEYRTELATMLVRGEDGIALGRRHAQILDTWMAAMFERARARVSPRGAYALAAVGSYGRGALALKSDVDVRLLVTGNSRDREEAVAFSEAILYPLWDAGLSVGHQVMEASEAIKLAHEDLATATSLLDLRRLASCSNGASLVDDLLRRAWEGLFAEANLASFVDKLEGEAAARHQRFGASVYLLEPDVKNGAGGIRDLDAVRWAARARYRVGSGRANDVGGVDGIGLWRELVRLGVLVSREADEIERAEQLLWRVRNRLHAHAERRSDRLTFDEQESIAIELGYMKEGDEVPPSRGDRHEARAAAAERLMQDYYLQARAVTRARERIFERARPPRRRARPVEADLGGGVKLFDGQVTVGSFAELAKDPALALRAVTACVRHGAPILAFAREAIARATADPAWCEALRASAQAARLFVELICTVPEVRTGRGSVAGELHDLGLLLAMIPEFQPVTGRVHHDTYHVYTVDVHSVAAVDCLRALSRGELAHIHPVASRLAAEMPRPRPVFLATLLHDVGKGYPDASGSRKNHSVSGAELCDTILPRLGLSPEEIAEARALVLQHLAMYHVATRRDLDDPATVSEFARLVLGREGLKHLYLVTVVDISTTSPTAMTSWKARMLEELYIATDAYLAGAKLSGIDEERVDRVREAARSFWMGERAFFEQFLATMPDRYLLANAPDAVAAHAQVAFERSEAGAAVRAAIVPSRHAEVAEVCVIAEDRPGLLARIAAAITAGRLEVLAAQVYSRVLPGAGPGGADRTEAVDLFWVRDRVDGSEAAGRALGRLVKDLDAVCTGAVAAETLLDERAGGGSPWRERPSPAVVTEVVVEDRASPRHTVIEVFAKDRPGLLYTLARALHELGLSIALSKINTEGTRVADVFYVSELDGAKVTPGERFKTIRDALTTAIG